MQETLETCVQSLGWEDALEENMATHSNILAWRIPMDRGAWWASSRVCRVSHNWSDLAHKKNPLYLLPQREYTAASRWRPTQNVSLSFLKRPRTTLKNGNGKSLHFVLQFTSLQYTKHSPWHHLQRLNQHLIELRWKWSYPDWKISCLLI